MNGFGFENAGSFRSFDSRILELAENLEISTYLETERPSAHSDLADELFHAAKGLPCRWFCPDTPAYAFALLHTSRGVAFAVAVGMNDLLVRLPEPLAEEARKASGRSFPPLRSEWVSFRPFAFPKTTTTSRRELERWFAKACTFAQTLTSEWPRSNGCGTR